MVCPPFPCSIITGQVGSVLDWGSPPSASRYLTPTATIELEWG